MKGRGHLVTSCAENMEEKKKGKGEKIYSEKREDRTAREIDIAGLRQGKEKK